MIRRFPAAAAVLLMLICAVPGAPAQATGPTGSAVTVHGRKGANAWDDYSGLEITVSQTRDLTSQGIAVVWKGAAPTGDGAFWGKNYLQFMQCWGPDPDADDFRETCQYGRGNVPDDPRQSIGLGNGNNTRGLLTPDPAEPLLAAKALSVPFQSVDGVRTPDGSKAHPYLDENKDGYGENDGVGDHFTQFTTNEIPYARTTFDGTGRAVFEVQASTRSPALGCGKSVSLNGKKTPRPCWLVIVPRGDHDATGVKVDGKRNGRVMDGSPLSTSFFANRIAVRLDFQPVDQFCPEGKDERLTLGSEMIAQAIGSWQPTLCAGTGPVFGFSTAGDGEAGDAVRVVDDGKAGLAFVTEPVNSPAVVHAPVALSAAVIALQIETKINPTTDVELEKKRGTLVTELNLTPRLVAKLLTQSYRSDVPGGAAGDAPAYLAKNYSSIVDDPEFTELNKDFKFFAKNARPDGLMVTGGNSALARQVWNWVLADPVAAEWLKNGKAADTLMVLNENYRPIFADGRSPENFPKAETRCVKAPSGDNTWCTLDSRPYLGTLQDAAAQTLRGDAKPKNVWDPNALPPAFKVAPPQPIGQRFALSITDAASAARYGLVTAKLRNRHGDLVAPTSQSLLAATAAMKAGPVAGVLTPDPGRSVDGAYPLTMLTYAAVNTAQAQAARTDYAQLLRYAAGKGQVSGTLRGQLPAGYVPLPAELRAQTVTVAGQVAKARPTKPPAAPPKGGTSGASPPAGGSTDPPPGVPNSGAGPVPVATPSTPGGPQPSIAPVALITTGDAVGPMRFALLAVLGLGLLGAIAGPIVLAIGKRRRQSTAISS